MGRSTSLKQMIMNENDWPSRHLAGQNNGAMPVQAHHHQFPAPTMHQMQFQPHPASQAVGTMFPYQPNMPSCGNSSSSAPGGGLTMPMYCHYKPTQQRHQHRQNIPATTTTTMTAAGVASSGVAGLPVPPPSIQIVAATAANANRHLYGGGENLDSETSGSSNGSFDEPSGRNYHRQYRYTIPSISTTSDSCSEFSTDVTDTSRHLDIHHLYAPGPTCINEEEPSTSKDEMKALDHKQVRRVASFTCSPPESTDKYNKRVVDEKKTKPSITKKISAFFSKELTSSMSQLHHSQEEIRSWGQNLENLLNHKAGFYYLKQHMQSQRSDENIDFWKECEEYKKMKEGKKALQKAQLIYNEYLIESALRQVNLESEVMKATKAAFESGPKPDTFSLAQSKIELLIQQGPYVSFLQSPIYLNLVKPSSEDAKSAHSA
ncbi:hypothetical protein L596_030163 [Steinernema carpocapsae]|uniref:RGS domain-containing protein n=1 Tax=Steinernema carpocapsae TaxID=34508 RepID=A0A4V5ZX83_STECR|nr:hypothetical protein L596_030163 [Steinernema carpocapsae]